MGSLAPAEVLMLGEVIHAKSEFESLKETCRVIQITSGTRSDFLERCKKGEFDQVKAISRTVESAQYTGLFDEALVQALPPSIRFISHNGAGYDQITVPACSARGIQVSNTPGSVDLATADMAVFLLLGAMRRAWIAQSAIRAGSWRGQAPLGHDPEGKTVGILGMGGIGTAFAARAAAFGFSVQYHNRSPVRDLASKLPHVERLPLYVDFETLLRTSDVISIHMPLTPKTRHTIGAKQLGMMKHGVTIINTARGAVIDEQALVDALADGDRIWSVGLDVFEEEPKVHPELLKNERVMLLPHIGTATVETQKKMEVQTIDNVRSALSHGRLLNPVA